MREKLLSLPFESFDLLEGKLLVATLEQETEWVIYVCAHDRKEDFIGGFITNRPMGELIISAIGQDEVARSGMHKVSNVASLLKVIKAKASESKKKNKEKADDYISINKSLYKINFSSQCRKNSQKHLVNQKMIRLPVLEGGDIETLIAVTTSESNPIKSSQKKTGNKDFEESSLYKIDIHLDIFKFLKNFLTNKHKFDKVILVNGLTIWDKEQLIHEIKANQWLIIEPQISDIFTNNPQNLWENIIKNALILDKNFFASYVGNC